MLLFHRLFLTPGPRCFRAFTTCPLLLAKPLPPRPTVDEKDMTEVFLKGTGPGGQKINKTSSAVQLKHLPTGIVIKCQETRSRSQNRKIARRIIAERVEELQLGDQSRTALKTEREKKKKASKTKKANRKYKKLADVQKDALDQEEEEGQGEDEQLDTDHAHHNNPAPASSLASESVGHSQKRTTPGDS